jgi:hypothetical protein
MASFAFQLFSPRISLARGSWTPWQSHRWVCAASLAGFLSVNSVSLFNCLVPKGWLKSRYSLAVSCVSPAQPRQFSVAPVEFRIVTAWRLGVRLGSPKKTSASFAIFFGFRFSAFFRISALRPSDFPTLLPHQTQAGPLSISKPRRDEEYIANPPYPESQRDSVCSPGLEREGTGAAFLPLGEKVFTR